MLRLDDITLGAAGLGVGFHPSSDAPTVFAIADGELEVCPADVRGQRAGGAPGASYGTLWQDGCRALSADPIELPTTNGRQHVGVRIVPVGGSGIEITSLRMSWACADAHVVYDAGVLALPEAICRAPSESASTTGAG